MKKLAMIFCVLIAIFAAVVYVNKLYYPPLPVEGLSAKEAIDSLNDSDSKLTQIEDDGEFLWYLTRVDDKGIESADDKVKQLVAAKGWSFKEKDGSGLFFEKDGERLIATTQMWTGEYVLIQVMKF
ncbi:hypothetical protein [Ureibacillus sinduriensis]|uniref:Uncharacterized protein n=1 Tax=Ureibacillus sinduriensis BLB-1 = JCM 15800 TaxID=1384057 RepID=A0A0A3HUI0_9BACL|nr:hypothetical protein [Ureibacillus sinduriensis]KGR76241.1 hypothetical protein CD33_06745 [Ureibacillus sinduriensis BLB-1 = JCM 15800]